MRVVVVAGARPNFMKVAPILSALRATGREALLVHTGQHYDARMSDAFFQDLEIPEPYRHLGIGSGTHAEQVSRVMLAFEPVLREASPDWVVVVGDVNSTLACALVTAQLRPHLGCRLAHVEAGLRSGDWRMPEELNRVLTDRLADLLLLPSNDACANLMQEGIAAGRIVLVGNVMIDCLLQRLPQALERRIPQGLGLEPKRYAVCTIHRPSNVDSEESLRPVLEGMALVAKRLPVVMPLHPRTRQRIAEFQLDKLLQGFHITEPLGYVDMLSVTAQSAVVLTDSGGLQEETTSLGIPCITLREQTERPITVSQGTNRMCPWPLTPHGVYASFADALDRGVMRAEEVRIEGWDGRAAERIVAALRAAL